MGAHPSLTADEDKQEITLRATLHEYAPADINTDQAWTIVSQCLSVSEQSRSRSKLPTFLLWHPGIQRRLASLQGRLIVAAGVCVVILVAGINILFPLLPGSNSVAVAQQYQQVGLSQSSDGLTMTVEKAYASNKGTIIAYEVQPPANFTQSQKKASFVLAGPSLGPKGAFTVKDQTEQLDLHATGILTVGCTDVKQHDWPLKCVIELPAFHPPLGINKLNITWDIIGFELDSTRFFVRQNLSGHWHFQFTVPFHYEKSLPSLPYPIDQLSPISPNK